MNELDREKYKPYTEIYEDRLNAISIRMRLNGTRMKDIVAMQVLVTGLINGGFFGNVRCEECLDNWCFCKAHQCRKL